nr:MAG TPA: DNA helicase [Caudoviricetes sp.]
MAIVIAGDSKRQNYLYLKSDNKSSGTKDSGILNRLVKYFNKIPPYQLLPMYPGIPRPEIFVWSTTNKKTREPVYVTYFGLYKQIEEYLSTKEKLVQGIDWFYHKDITGENEYDCNELIKNEYFIEEYPTFESFLHSEFYMDFEIKMKTSLSGIVPREYQVKAAYNILCNRMSLSQLATRSGKTLITWIVISYLLHENPDSTKVLMIVPSVHLVKQGMDDFLEYSVPDGMVYDIEYYKTGTKKGQVKSKTLKKEVLENLPGLGGIYHGSGFKDDFGGYQKVVIGTFQSLIKKLDVKSKQYNPSFFKDFNVLIVDEAHKLPCKSIGDILKACDNNVEFKFGLTGTLPKENTIESQTTHSLSGPCIQNIDAIELINEDILAEPIITQVRIKYNYNKELQDKIVRYGEELVLIADKKTRDFVLPTTLQLIKQKYLNNHISYDDYVYALTEVLKSVQKLHILENKLIQDCTKRLDIIGDIIEDMDYKFSDNYNNGVNGIVFAHNTEYITTICKYLEQRYNGKEKNTKKIVKITGEVSLNKRQEIIELMENSANVILVGSFGAVGTGLTFKNVQYGIFAQSFKSEIIVKQSLGRLMLKGSTGNPEQDNYFYLFDMIDEFKMSGKLKKHGSEKLNIYKKEGYKVEIEEVLI